MSQKVRQRCHLLLMLMNQRVTLRKAGGRRGVTYRHTEQLKKKLATEVTKDLIHANRGRPSPNVLTHELNV